MLVGLNYPQITDAETWSELVSHILPYARWDVGPRNTSKFYPEDVRIVNPQTLDQYIDVLKSYKPNVPEKLLFIVNPHYNLIDRDDSANFRYFDLGFDKLGGTVWGEPPSQFLDTSLTYKGELTDLHDFEITTRYHARQGRAALKTTSRYLGRFSTMPHTISMGVSEHFPARSQMYLQFLRSMPSLDNWWQGVGTLNTDKRLLSSSNTLKIFEDVRTVALTEKAYDLLTTAGFEPARFVLPSLPFRYTDTYCRSYGSAFRATVESQLDNSDWVH